MPRFNDPTTELTYLEKGDVLMGGSPGDFSNIKAENMFQRALTYAQLEALVTASALVPAMWYKITNATAASFNLLVQAIDVNKIGCDAKDPLYPNDKIMYNFASNVITWRWDTVRDVSAGEDWRNSNNLQIPDSCTKISIGTGCILSIGENCKYFDIGNDVYADGALASNIGDNVQYLTIKDSARVPNIFENSRSIYISEGSFYDGLGVGQNIQLLGEGCSLNIPPTKSASGIFLFSSSLNNVSDSLIGVTAYGTGADVSAATYIYSVSQSKTIQIGNAGAARLIYLDNTNTLVNVDAES